MLSGETPNREALVAAMRAFKYEALDLSLLPDEDDLIGKKRDPKFYAPLWIKGLTGLGWGVGWLGWLLLFGMRFPRSGEPEPWVAQNFWYCFGALFILSGLTSWGTSVLGGYTEKRWAALFRANNLRSISPGEKLPGAVSNGGGVVRGARLPEPAQAVTFGTYDGWFDPDHEYFRPGDASQTYQLFIDVYVPELKFEPVYVMPKRPADFTLLPQMNDKAKAALLDLSSRYAVVIGRSGITVSVAGGMHNPYSSSLMGSIEHASRWALCTKIINKQLADIVEGIQV